MLNQRVNSWFYQQELGVVNPKNNHLVFDKSILQYWRSSQPIHNGLVYFKANPEYQQTRSLRQNVTIYLLGCQQKLETDYQDYEDTG